HVYVEKPMATSTTETRQLMDLAKDLDQHLMVGHLLLYHPAVSRLKQLIESGYLGDIRYIQSDRLNYNAHRSDRAVFWDLAPHDLSMMIYLLGRVPQRVVSVLGSKTSADELVDIAHIELDSGSGIVGHIHNSWVHPFKQVKLIVRGTERSAVIDDTLPLSEKLQVFDHNHPQDKELPTLLGIEPLKLECQHFISAIKNNRRPKTDGVNGMKVVEILEDAESKLQLSNEPLNLVQA
ncbi:MAG: Gfo/Idh/MocA family oxidoreductase, partial [Cyanobacteria bacterium HKST-UBA05]|nr:Gfo/Idh/MocA family oxidoreductase [Cyanobacteria bacterium HKST-UBA05]